MTKFLTIAVITNTHANNIETLKALYKYLLDGKYKVLLDENCKAFIDDSKAKYFTSSTLKTCDIAIIIGGDGTLLHAARSLATFEIPIVGINQGRLGFLVDIRPDEMIEKLTEILDGNYTEEERFLLRSRVIRNSECIAKCDALNDVVITNYREIRMIEFSTIINDRIINYDRADGIIIATPTGSTAYALSSGGPILHPSLEAITLVPICPHALNHRPLVVDAKSKIEIKMEPSNQIKGLVTFDGDENIRLFPGDRIEVSRSSIYAKLVHPESYNFYDLLRQKLNWGKGNPENH